ncbi:MAG: hypothetical protein ACP5MV_04560 [Candidatus Parvarchaeum sp.]
MAEKKGFSYRHNLAFVSLVGIFLSITNALWAFLLSIAETENKNFAVVALFMAFGLFVIPMGMFLLKRQRFYLNYYAIATGIAFGIGNAVLMSIFSYKNSAIIYSLIAPTIIVFVVMDILVNKARIKKGNAVKFLFGGVIATIGFTLLALNGLNLSLITLYDVLISIFLIVVYGIAGFLLTQTGLKSKANYSSITTIAVFEIIAIAAFLPFSLSPFSLNGLSFSFIAGLVVSIGVMISFFGYNSLQKSSHAISYSSIMYILSEMETVFLVIFYSIFVGRLSVFVLFSIILIVAAIWYLSKESDTAFS